MGCHLTAFRSCVMMLTFPTNKYNPTSAFKVKFAEDDF